MGIEPAPLVVYLDGESPLGRLSGRGEPPGLDRSVAMAIAIFMALAITPRPKSRENGWELNQPLVVYLDGERPPGSFIRT